MYTILKVSPTRTMFLSSIVGRLEDRLQDLNGHRFSSHVAHVSRFSVVKLWRSFIGRLLGVHSLMASGLGHNRHGVEIALRCVRFRRCHWHRHLPYEA